MRPHLPILLVFSQYVILNVAETILYDLNVDPNEKVNQDPESSEYARIYDTLSKRSSYWGNHVLTIDDADSTNKKSTWKSNGGVSSWILSDKYSAPTIPRKYNHSGAPNIVFVLVDDWVSS